MHPVCERPNKALSISAERVKFLEQGSWLKVCLFHAPAVEEFKPSNRVSKKFQELEDHGTRACLWLPLPEKEKVMCGVRSAEFCLIELRCGANRPGN